MFVDGKLVEHVAAASVLVGSDGVHRLRLEGDRGPIMLTGEGVVEVAIGDVEWPLQAAAFLDGLDPELVLRRAMEGLGMGEGHVGRAVLREVKRSLLGDPSAELAPPDHVPGASI